MARLDPSARPTPRGRARVAADGGRLGESVLRRLGRRAALTAALDRADVRRSPAQVLGVMAVGAVVALVLGGAAAGPWAGLLLALLVPLAVLMTLRVRAARRRAAFADQLDDTLQLMAASLRAGLSVQRALEAVSQDAEAPSLVVFSCVLFVVWVGRVLVVV